MGYIDRSDIFFLCLTAVKLNFDERTPPNSHSLIITYIFIEIITQILVQHNFLLSIIGTLIVKKHFKMVDLYMYS